MERIWDLNQKIWANFQLCHLKDKSQPHRPICFHSQGIKTPPLTSQGCKDHMTLIQIFLITYQIKYTTDSISSVIPWKKMDLPHVFVQTFMKCQRTLGSHSTLRRPEWTRHKCSLPSHSVQVWNIMCYGWKGCYKSTERPEHSVLEEWEWLSGGKDETLTRDI